MIPFKKILQFSVALCICSFTFSTFAVDQAANEETTPPGDDGPLTAEQLPPIDNTTRPPGGGAELPKPPAVSPIQPGQPANQAAHQQ